MRPRSAALVAAALLAVLPACKGDAKRSASTETTGAPTTVLADPLADPAVAVTTTTTGDPGAAPTTTRQRGSATGATTATTRPQPAPSTSAQGALDSYLDGLRTEDYGAAMANSTEGPRLLAFVRHVLKTVNQRNGATSTFAYLERSYTPTISTPDRVVFSGKAVLRQTTKLKDGKTESREVTLGEVATVQRNGVWLLNELVWMGAPVQYWRASSRAEISPTLSVRLGGAVSFGNSTSVILVFEAREGSNIQIADDRLRAGAEDASRIKALVENYAYFDYPRHDAPPRSWTANITGGGSTRKPVTLAFD